MDNLPTDRIAKAVEKVKSQRYSVLNSESPSRTNRVDRANIRNIVLDSNVLQRNRIISGEWFGPEFAQSYKVLRTRVWQRMKEQGWTSLGITSTSPGEGKSLTAINLAISMALMDLGKTVVLVDFDMRRPSLHKALGFEPKCGIVDYLLGDVPLDQVLVDPGAGSSIGPGRLYVLPGNVSIGNSSELLSSPRIKQLFRDINFCFPTRLTIFDLPPVLATDDVLAFAPMVDTFLLVLEDGRSKADDASRAMHLLKNRNVIGTVLNKSRDKASSYGYY